MPKATPVAGTEAPAAATPDQWAEPDRPAPTAVPTTAPRTMATGELSEDTDFLAIGYYGLEGTGKTIDLCSMAHFGQMLLINAEGGAKVRALRNHGIPAEHIRVWPDPMSSEPITFEALEALYDQTKRELREQPGYWAGIGADSVTEIVRQLIGDERTRQFLANQRRGGSRSRWFTDREDWGAVTTQVGELLRKFRALPCHFGFTALVRKDGLDAGPSANPGVASDLPGFVDLLVHTEVQDLGDDGDLVYSGWLKQHETRGVTYKAKDRYGVFPPAVPDPTFDRLVAWVRGNLDRDTDDRLNEVRQRRAHAAQAAAAEAESAAAR